MFEIQRAVGHARQGLAARRADHPFVVSALGQSPCGHLAGSSVGQNPIGPTCVIERERPAEFDGIHAEHVQHVGVNNRELLHGIINAQRLGWQPQMLPQLGVGNRRDPGRAMPGKIDRNPVRLAVLETPPARVRGMSSPASSFRRWYLNRVGLLSFHNLNCLSTVGPCQSSASLESSTGERGREFFDHVRKRLQPDDTLCARSNSFHRRLTANP